MKENLTSKKGKISPTVLNERIALLLQEFFSETSDEKVEFSVSFSKEMAVLVAQSKGKSLQLSFQEDMP